MFLNKYKEIESPSDLEVSLNLMNSHDACQYDVTH